jgi:hypothetical protein
MIERRAGVTLPQLAGEADAAREPCEELQQEVMTVLSPICDLEGFSAEAALLTQVEGQGIALREDRPSAGRAGPPSASVQLPSG